jgi:hypothetical protein
MALIVELLIIAGIVLLVAFRLLLMLSPRISVRAGILPKRWQLWLLGQPSTGKPPNPDTIL